MELVVGSRVFTSRAAAVRYCQHILNNYQPDPETDAFLYSLLLRHPDSTQKIGQGVASFSVRASGYGGVCFWLTRVDGTETDWSFHTCLKPISAETKVRAAFRDTIRPQIDTFRDQASVSVCPLSGVTLRPGETHVDHIIPFETLLQSFLSGEGLEITNVKVDPALDGQTHHRLSNQDLACRWYEFHRLHARLRIVSARANLSRRS